MLSTREVASGACHVLSGKVCGRREMKAVGKQIGFEAKRVVSLAELVLPSLLLSGWV